MADLIVDRWIAFGHWRFDRETRRLFRRNANGAWESAAVGSRAAEILAVLLEEPGSLVTKGAIMAAAWPQIAVEPNNLTVQITALRAFSMKAVQAKAAYRLCLAAVTGSFFQH